MRTLHCKNCTSDNVSVRAWVNINTLQYQDPADDADSYCEDCKELVDIVSLHHLYDKEDILDFLNNYHDQKKLKGFAKKHFYTQSIDDLDDGQLDFIAEELGFYDIIT